MQPGEKPKRVTMTQVATLAGVSVMTVSYTFNRPDRVSEDRRAKVLAAAAALGYGGPDPAAKSLRYGSTRVLGLILGEHLTYAFEDPQAASFLAGVAEVCAQWGYGLLMVPVTGAADDPKRVVGAAVDAFIVWTTTDDDPVLDAVVTAQRPAVIHGSSSQKSPYSVSIDNRAAAFAMATQTFAHAKRPAVISFPLDRTRAPVLTTGIDPETALFPVTRERLLGYRDAAQTLGIPWSSVLVGVSATNNTREAQALAAQMLALDPPIDAIAAMSDQQAIGVLNAAKAARVSVPDRLTVSGWDDAPAAAQHLLSSVKQDLRAQGVACARLALGEPSPSFTDDWSIVIRSSTAK
ncbi:LacI family DNA-binding transcriptional regulator [Deinococcus hopiensis]|uniref:LacI family DNA-binding transcriptional regulator n=1 Tax=Deinococcus hopiensis TaxID=309885 RepID=UPI001BAF8180|nr:LacI family DNA-binding transcriptional regulator [Deinococcus hopiensis]